MNHTPGPWTIPEDSPNVVKNNRHGTIAIAYDPNDSGHITKTSQSNALLIAAAPDLLAACKAALGTWPESLDTKETRQLRAAIAKARGQS